MLIFDNNVVRVYFALSPDIPARGAGRGEAERAAVCRLLGEAFGGDDTPLLKHLPSGAPVLEGVEASVSVSHCPGGVCVAIGASGCRVGIDAESGRRGAQLGRVAGKFLSSSQAEVWGAGTGSLLKGWVIKEALYKAASSPGMPLHEIPLPASCDADSANLVLGGRCYNVNLLSVSGFDGIVAVAAEVVS